MLKPMAAKVGLLSPLSHIKFNALEWPVRAARAFENCQIVFDTVLRNDIFKRPETYSVTIGVGGEAVRR